MLGPDLRRMAVDVADERLLAVVDDLHGTVRLQGEQRAVDLHRQVLATAEGAAHTREVDSHLLRLQVQARRNLVAVDVQPLRRDVDVDSALAVRHREPGLGPEERLVLDPDLVDPGDRDIALGVGVSVLDDERADDVRTRIVAVAVAHRRPVGMERVLLRRALRIDDELERLVLDADPLGGAARLLRMLGRNERDGLAEVAHALEGEHRLVLELEAVPFLAGNILVREYRVHTGHTDRFRDVDRHDAGVGMWAAHRVTPEHPRRLQITGVGEVTRHLRDPVDPRHALADTAELQLGCSGLAHDKDAAAVRTASKILAYPVQRQRFPDSASRISSSLG